MDRDGITPVVAVVLLLLMAVTAAGSAYAWITTTTGQAQSETEQQLRTELQVRDIGCGGGKVRVVLSNSGDRELTGDVTAYLYRGDELVATHDAALSGADYRTPGGVDKSVFNFSTPMRPSTGYHIEVSFASEGYTTSGQCQTSAQDCQGIASGGFGATTTYRLDPDGDGGASPFITQCVMPAGYTNLTYEFLPGANRSVGIGGSEKCGGQGAQHYDHLTMNELATGTFGSGTYESEVSYQTWNGTNLTEAQEDALRSRTGQLGDTTRIVSVSCDDDAQDTDETAGHDFDTNVYWPASGTDMVYSVGGQADSGVEGYWILDDGAGNTFRTDDGGSGFVGDMHDSLPANATMPDQVRLDWSGSGSGYGTFSFEKSYVLVK